MSTKTTLTTTTTTLAPVNATTTLAPVKTSAKKPIKTVKNTEKVNTDLQSFVDGINTVNSDGLLVYSCKNNLRTALCKLGYMVNGKSTEYRPLDAYLRFNSGVQFQLLYSSKSKSFTGFNIRLTDIGERVETDENGQRVTVYHSEFDQRKLFDFVGTVFTGCDDNKRITKSDKIDFIHFAKCIELLNGIN